MDGRSICRVQNETWCVCVCVCELATIDSVPGASDYRRDDAELQRLSDNNLVTTCPKSTCRLQTAALCEPNGKIIHECCRPSSCRVPKHAFMPHCVRPISHFRRNSSIHRALAVDSTAQRRHLTS